MRRWHGGPSEMLVCTQCAEALLRRAYLFISKNARDPMLVYDLQRIVERHTPPVSDSNPVHSET